ncbi:MAG TPA: hypothetical protein VLJ38_20075, partial [Polyangiaceae bacterium]|nr:hypothetical protein [Polyangiaceae bacterium]
ELERLAGADASRARPSLVRIEHDAGSGTYRLTLEVAGQHRELTHTDCRVLLRSAAVISAASVKVDAPPPVVAPVASSPPQAMSSSPSVTRQDAPPVTEPHARSSEPTRRLHGHVAVGGGIAVGVVPAATPAAEVRGGISRGAWGATLAGRYFAPQSATVEGRVADIRGYGLRAAGVLAPTTWLSVSLGLDIELLVGRGRDGVAVPATDSAWTLAPSAELAAIPIQNEHLALELAVLGRVALVRPVFEVGGFGALYRVPSLGMAALARGVWRFR